MSISCPSSGISDCPRKPWFFSEHDWIQRPESGCQGCLLLLESPLFVGLFSRQSQTGLPSDLISCPPSLHPRHSLLLAYYASERNRAHNSCWGPCCCPCYLCPPTPCSLCLAHTSTNTTDLLPMSFTSLFKWNLLSETIPGHSIQHWTQNSIPSPIFPVPLSCLSFLFSTYPLILCNLLVDI